jgi:hypothetical protein
MSRACCDFNCRQGRDCPLRSRRAPLSAAFRIAAAMAWALCMAWVLHQMGLTFLHWGMTI